MTTKEKVLSIIAIISCLKAYKWSQRHVERIIIDFDKKGEE